MRVSSMCSLVSVYLHYRANMRTVFIWASTLSSLSCFIDLNLIVALLKLVFGARYFLNRSQYTDNVFDSGSDWSQVLETPMYSSLDHRSRYFTITFQFGAFLFGARQFGAFQVDAIPVRRVSLWLVSRLCLC